MDSESLTEQVAQLPSSPGVYLFKDAQGRLLYVGKAASLKARVSSYFHQHANLSPRIAALVRQVASIETRPAGSEAEALLYEAQLIKEQQPKYNVLFRDDKTYPMLKITHEPFPRLVVARRRLNDGARYFGPYVDAGLMRQAVDLMRKLFPLRTCRRFPKSPCLEFYLGQCMAPCVGKIDASQYAGIVRELALFLEGKRGALLKELTRKMQEASRGRRYETAAHIRDQLQAFSSVIAANAQAASHDPLEQLQAALHLSRLPRRIEAFDISHLFGEEAVGSMVVFIDGRPHKSHYRKFKIVRVAGIDDYAMMREVLERRYGGDLATELPLPDLILVDGGKGQLAVALEVLRALPVDRPVIGLAKRLEQIVTPDQEEPIVLLRSSPVLQLLQHVRDEAHRFAITYHRSLKRKKLVTSSLESIPGVGPHRARALLSHFGSLGALRSAPLEDIAQVSKGGTRIAEQIKRQLSAGGASP